MPAPPAAEHEAPIHRPLLAVTAQLFPIQVPDAAEMLQLAPTHAVDAALVWQLGPTHMEFRLLPLVQLVPMHMADVPPVFAQDAPMQIPAPEFVQEEP